MLILDRIIEETAADLPPAYAKKLYLIYSENKNNAEDIISYIAAMRNEVNLAIHYRRDLIEILTRFSRFKNKPFKDITRADVIEFLGNYRRTDATDPLHKWIGTYNLYRIHLMRFLKWVYYPDVEPDKRPKPSVIENIARLKRKEQSIYKPSDLWTQQDDLLFLKLCPSKRMKCYHVISRDTSCRPHEILKLKIRDIAFKTIGTSQYAEAVVNGKTGTRPIPLINSIPYLKDYLDHEHPMPSNPNAPLICGTRKGLGRSLSVKRITTIYDFYKQKLFPKLLKSPNILPEDKQKIQELLKNHGIHTLEDIQHLQKNQLY